MAKSKSKFLSVPNFVSLEVLFNTRISSWLETASAHTSTRMWGKYHGYFFCRDNTQKWDLLSLSVSHMHTCLKNLDLEQGVDSLQGTPGASVLGDLWGEPSSNCFIHPLHALSGSLTFLFQLHLSRCYYKASSKASCKLGTRFNSIDNPSSEDFHCDFHTFPGLTR